MVKRLMVKTGDYQKDGQTKGRYTEVGVIMSNDKGEYALLDPAVNLAGVLIQQQILADKNGGRSGDRVMCSIFDNDGQQNSGGQQRQQSGNRGQGQQNNGGGYDQGGGYGQQQGNQGGNRDLDDEIPF